MSLPALQFEAGAHPPARNVRGVSPTRTSSPGFHHDYPAENHRQVIVLSDHRLEIFPRSAADLRQQQLKLIREAQRRRDEEAFYASLADATPGPTRSKRRGKGRRRHQRL